MRIHILCENVDAMRIGTVNAGEEPRCYLSNSLSSLDSDTCNVTGVEF